MSDGTIALRENPTLVLGLGRSYDEYMADGPGGADHEARGCICCKTRNQVALVDANSSRAFRFDQLLNRTSDTINRTESV